MFQAKIILRLLYMWRQRVNHLYCQFRFLRVVAYRQFTRLIHGRLRDKRIPLPSCAYNAIRSTHKPKQVEQFTGYDELESNDDNEN